MSIQRLLSSLPSNTVPYTVVTFSIVFPTMMATKEQLSCCVFTAVFFEFAFIGVCIGLDLLGQKLSNTSPLSRFLEPPERNSFLDKMFSKLKEDSTIHGFAAPAA
jgi:hypothetical protein